EGHHPSLQRKLLTLQLVCPRPELDGNQPGHCGLPHSGGAGMSSTKGCKQPDHTPADCCDLRKAHSGFSSRLSGWASPGALLAAVAAVLALAGAADAQVTSIDNFESYADSTALRMVWVALAPLPSSSVTLDPAGITGKSMSIAYDVSTGTNTV